MIASVASVTQQHFTLIMRRVTLLACLIRIKRPVHRGGAGGRRRRRRHQRRRRRRRGGSRWPFVAAEPLRPAKSCCCRCIVGIETLLSLVGRVELSCLPLLLDEGLEPVRRHAFMQRCTLLLSKPSVAMPVSNRLVSDSLSTTSYLWNGGVVGKLRLRVTARKLVGEELVIIT